jgi:hypothetical protein
VHDEESAKKKGLWKKWRPAVTNWLRDSSDKGWLSFFRSRKGSVGERGVKRVAVRAERLTPEVEGSDTGRTMIERAWKDEAMREGDDVMDWGTVQLWLVVDRLRRPILTWLLRTPYSLLECPLHLVLVAFSVSAPCR